MKNLMFLRTVNANIFRCSIVRNLIVKCRQLGHFDKIAETLFLNQIVGDGKLKVGGFFSEDCRPSVKTADLLTFKLVRAQILEQQIQLRKRVADCRTGQECGSEVFARPLLNGADGVAWRRLRER